MTERTYLLLLHLRNGQSIGPARLGSMWSHACGSTLGTSVSCDQDDFDARDRVTYRLKASTGAAIEVAEGVMRRMLDADGLSFRMTRSR